MPRTAINYSKTYIYKLVSKDPTIIDIYVGHTTDPTTRKWCHKNKCNNSKNKEYNYNVYQHIRANGGWDNWEMIIIECICCIDAHDARTNERRWVDELKATLNKSIPSRTLYEWYIDNKEIISEKSKQYYKQNKEIINKKAHENYEQNKDVINKKHKEYREQNKEIINEKSKQYYEQNKDKIIDIHQKYYEQNKDEINRKRREQYALKKLQNTDQNV